MTNDHFLSEHYCVMQVPIFNHLDEQPINAIHQKIKSRMLSKGEYLFHAQGQADTLFIIQSGAIRVFRILESGKEQLIRILKPGDFIGEWSLFNSTSQHAEFACALVDTRVCQLSSHDFHQVLMDYPAVSLKILEVLSQRLQESEKMTTQVANVSVGNRLADYLITQYSKLEDDSLLIKLDMSRKEIAAFLGTTPETVSRKFKELEERQLIKSQSPRKILLLDLEGLTKLEL